jgi:hypothetical protein
MKKTAIEWLESNLPTAFKDLTINKQLIEQAKELEKEQLINFHLEVMKIGLIQDGGKKWLEMYTPKIIKIAEEYYNEQFKNK